MLLHIILLFKFELKYVVFLGGWEDAKDLLASKAPVKLKMNIGVEYTLNQEDNNDLFSICSGAGRKRSVVVVVVVVAVVVVVITIYN